MRSTTDLYRWAGMLTLAAIAIGSAVAYGDPPQCGGDEAGFVPIFDGKTHKGWNIVREDGKKVEKPDAFFIEDGAVHGKAYGGYWYRYEAEQLDNFILRMQFKMSKGANSGVCIRTKKKGIPWQTGFEIQLLDDHGKPPNKHTTGAIYDVVNPMYNESKPVGQWNDLEIVCDGKLIKISVNGFKLIDTDFGKLTMPLGKFPTPYNDLPLKGYICFQDHGQPVSFRNMRVKKLPPRCSHGDSGSAKCTSRPDDETGFTSLFNGSGADGWAVYPDKGEKNAGAFVLKDGVIHCPGSGGNYYRYEASPFDDFVLRLEWRVPKAETNSGVCLRARKKGSPPYTGFEVQIRDKDGPNLHSTGAIYDIAAPMYDNAKKPGEWNEAEITCDGLLVKVVLNGLKVIDTDFSKLTTRRGKFKFPYAELPRSGYIAFQDHGHEIDFRNIRIKPIKR